MEILVITQARTGSTRLPGKVLKIANGQTLLSIHLSRIRQSALHNHLILATTNLKVDDPIESVCKEMGVEVYRGSEEDVLDRYYHAALPHRPKWVMRLTADCPLIDPLLIDVIITYARSNPDLEYISNTLSNSYPDGQDVEIFSFAALQNAWKHASLPSEREHVTPFIRANFLDPDQFSRADLHSGFPEYKNLRMTVDEISDFILIESLINKYGTDKDWKYYAQKILDDELDKLNSGIIRNEGFLKSLEKDNEQIRKFQS